jgi:hypothetical protein
LVQVALPQQLAAHVPHVVGLLLRHRGVGARRRGVGGKSLGACEGRRPKTVKGGGRKLLVFLLPP